MTNPDKDDTLPSEEPDADRIQPTELLTAPCGCGWKSSARSLTAIAAAVYQHCRYKHSGLTVEVAD